MNVDPVSDANTPPAGSERRLLIRLGIGVVAACFLAMVALLFYSWAARPAPTSAVVVVEADERLEGATVRLEGSGAQPWIRKIEREENYVARIQVPPGNYSLKIEHEGRLVYEVPLFEMKESTYLPFRLVRKPEEKK